MEHPIDTLHVGLLKYLTGHLKGSGLSVATLGNGASIAAVKDGKCMDTSMGLTPLEGLMMGTRSGDIDPAVVFYVMKHENLTIGEMDSLLNKHSGLLGVSGISGDMREIEAAVNSGNERAKLRLTYMNTGSESTSAPTLWH